MVESRGKRDPDHPAQALWEDAEHEHDGKILFHRLRGEKRALSWSFHLGRGGISGFAGDVSGHQPFPGPAERNRLSDRAAKAVRASCQRVCEAGVPVGRRLSDRIGKKHVPQKNH